MKRIFVSYSWKNANVNDRNNVINLLNNRSNFNFADYSVDYEEPLTGDVWNQIENRIKNANVVLITAGVYASYSDSIQKEIKLAQKYNKPIIAILPFGSVNSSTIAKDNANIIVKHNTEAIVSSIRNIW